LAKASALERPAKTKDQTKDQRPTTEVDVDKLPQVLRLARSERVAQGEAKR
jgi:hypothetical protein